MKKFWPNCQKCWPKPTILRSTSGTRAESVGQGPTLHSTASHHGLKSYFRYDETQLSNFNRRHAELVDEGLIANLPPDELGTVKKKRGPKKQNPPKNLLDRLHNHKSVILFEKWSIIDFRDQFCYP